MPILNENVVFSREPAGAQAAFVNRSAHRIQLPARTRLYKLTGYGTVSTNDRFSPWWALVIPMPGTNDPGLDGHITAAAAAGQSMLEYGRAKFAVMLQWNALGNTQSGLAKVVEISLKQPVYAFGGFNQRMRETVPAGRVVGTLNVHRSPLNPPIQMGGAYQYYIPNLTGTEALVVRNYMLP
jgi:hypothetical protein